MISLNPDEVRDRIAEVVQAHFDEFSSPELLTDDLYKLFDELVTDAVEEEEDEE